MFFPVYISGPSGNGKTMMVEQACAKANREYVRAQISPETDEPETGESLHKKLRQTDLYRNQNFAISHSKIAKALKYEL